MFNALQIPRWSVTGVYSQTHVLQNVFGAHSDPHRFSQIDVSIAQNHQPFRHFVSHGNPQTPPNRTMNDVICHGKTGLAWNCPINKTHQGAGARLTVTRLTWQRRDFLWHKSAKDVSDAISESDHMPFLHTNTCSSFSWVLFGTVGKDSFGRDAMVKKKSWSHCGIYLILSGRWSVAYSRDRYLTISLHMAQVNGKSVDV